MYKYHNYWTKKIIESATTVKRQTKQISLVFILIPLVLSAYTHLWNPTGFPSIHVDEGHYLRKAISTETGQGLQPQDRYRAPYFGQIFLAGIFSIIGYPNLDSLGDKNPVEHLYLVPRVIMGILAVVDTFLLYRITEYRYGRNVALIASILFAVMPFTWMTRRIFLESIRAPFILTSILLILNLSRGSQLQSQQLERKQQQLPQHQDQQQLQQKQQQPYHSEYTKFTLIISGIFLGLAIFTKIPSFHNNSAGYGYDLCSYQKKEICYSLVNTCSFSPAVVAYSCNAKWRHERLDRWCSLPSQQR